MTKNTYFTGPNLFLALIIGLILWMIIASLLDDKVNRSELLDDSIILVLGQYRFKVPVDYLYSKLLEKDLAKKKYNIERKFKKVAEVGYFSIDVTYPDMKPMTIAEDKPGWDNKIMIYLSINEVGVSDAKMASTRAKERIFAPGIVLEGFGSNEVLKLEDNVGKDRKPSSGDSDLYLYEDDLIFMRCDREIPEFSYPSPSCELKSSYKNLNISATFSVKYKTEFIKINSRITELFQSFELQSKEP